MHHTLVYERLDTATEYDQMPSAARPVDRYSEYLKMIVLIPHGAVLRFAGQP
jgi:hypothetical protein